HAAPARPGGRSRVLHLRCVTLTSERLSRQEEMLMSEASLSGTRVPRRTVVAGAGAAAVGAVVSLAACGTSSGTTATPSAPPAGSSAPSRGSAAPATGAVGTVADVPVGG